MRSVRQFPTAPRHPSRSLDNRPVHTTRVWTAG